MWELEIEEALVIALYILAAVNDLIWTRSVHGPFLARREAIAFIAMSALWPLPLARAAGSFVVGWAITRVRGNGARVLEQGTRSDPAGRKIAPEKSSHRLH